MTTPPNLPTIGRVLLVDDSAAARAPVVHALKRAGITVVEASDGVEAMWRARAESFDLVITDIHMPIKDGITLVRDLRALEAYAQVPIVILTSDCAAARLEEGKRAGATAWVVKPADVSLLVQGALRMIARGPGGGVLGMT